MLLLLGLASICLYGSVLPPVVQGRITCECTTDECIMERQRTCEAESFCYVERLHGITRGCIDETSPLLCENRKPSKLPTGEFGGRWPYLTCCKDDFCNSDIVPVQPTEKARKPEVKEEPEIDNSQLIKELTERRTPCPNQSSGDSSRLNPIYIAVPVAGVCVLLALIIFAMYLLRRRNDLYTNYETYAYHEQVANLNKKQTDAKACNGGGTLNRCTDSERSSQGSETKLFLNA